MGKRRWKAVQRLKNDAIFLGARGVFAFARAVPLAWGVRIGETLGGAAWRLIGNERRLALTHLKTAFPEWSDAERERIGRDSFCQLGRNLFEAFHFDEILASVDGPRPYVQFFGKEVLDKMRERGQGGIFITGHLGNWEVMAATFVRCGYPGSEVVRSLYDPRLDKLLNDHRRKFGYMPLTRGGAELIQDIIDIFSRNEFLGLLIDQDTKVRGVFANWFGHPAWTPSGAAYLCYQAGIDAVFLLNHRNPDGTYHVEVTEPLPRPQTGDTKADIQAYTQMFNDRLCEHIRAYPEQWVWMHRRWKTRPPGEPPEKHPAPRPMKPYRLHRLAEKTATRLAGLGSWETADRLGRWLGEAARYLRPRRGRQARQNLRKTFPDLSPAWRRETRRATFANCGRQLVTYLRHRLIDGRFFAERVEIDGVENLEAGLADGKGAVLIGTRLGGGELALWKLSAMGFSIDLAEPHIDHAYWRRQVSWLRKTRGLTPHPASRCASRMRSALRQGRLTFDLLDRSAGGRCVDVEWLGGKSPLPLSAARLALLTGAAVFPIACVRTAPGRYRVEIGKRLPTPRDAHDLAAATQAYADAVAKWIIEYPEQWHWDY